MRDNIIITCALTGSGDNYKANPAVPITPRQISDEAISAARAGAAIVHIHVRDPATGRPSMAPELYRETVDRIRDSGVDVALNLTTGPGARFVPSDEDAAVGGAGTTLTSPDARVAHVLDLRPELCSLDIASMNFGEHAMINVPSHLRRMAELVQSVGVKPELEVFDLGQARLAARMVEDGVIAGAPLFQLCLGVPWGAPANAEAMLALRGCLPASCVWAAFGISRMQFPCVALAAALGGHVRVGLEDNIYSGPKRLAGGNAELVDRAVRMIEAMGARVATPAETRSLLGVARREAPAPERQAPVSNSAFRP
jgi:uncharacterized protein (DUF849 family)